MNRQAQAVVLLLFGGAVVKASVTDMYLRYVKEGLRPFLIVAGLLLIAAAVMTLWYDLRRRRPTPATEGGPEHDHGHEHHGHDHGNGHHEPRVGWLLILPVLGLLLVSPPALGSYAAAQAGTALAGQQLSDYPPLPEGDPVKISVLDYASRAIFDEGASLGQRRVQLSGFVATGPDGQPMLARIILSCCAADGRPIKVGLEGEAPAGLAADTWVEVVGGYSPRTESDPVNGESIPYLRVESWREIPVPKQQYE
ncbi:TIGR03943 family protein [Micromonospora pattaloongensis]|uniref:TIGR03943 family protein n=1 Tax=Micromonospora pattaloongensis TaxID=405436 RepID=A0A1H3RJE5_9ACTN|nr:TIGR03943 family protein [Micromonospora pattaloongensis]SDZ25874.1 TIGR03943 family protein [Micromonospora pattaloongensis]